MTRDPTSWACRTRSPGVGECEGHHRRPRFQCIAERLGIKRLRDMVDRKGANVEKCHELTYLTAASRPFGYHQALMSYAAKLDRSCAAQRRSMRLTTQMERYLPSRELSARYRLNCTSRCTLSEPAPSGLRKSHAL